ncbi:MAG TPA: MerR family transcriptional regulator [Acidimicrobiales bacterium]|nr:MerR family transcriptional regulator [Acidimicrobiales bacterium]
MTESSPSRYRIGDLARVAGPAVSTLRSWQERYPGLLRPARTTGGHRVFDDADVAAVRSMQRLVAAGSTVSAAAAQVIGQRDGHPPGSPDDPDGFAADLGAAPIERGTRTWWASTAAEELDALRALHSATRAFLRATTPVDVAAAVARFVEEIGGTVHPAELGGRTALPLDLSLGATPPALAHAPAGSPARQRLEALLPVVVEDARLAASRLRADRARRGTGRSGGAQPGSGPGWGTAG